MTSAPVPERSIDSDLDMLVSTASTLNERDGASLTYGSVVTFHPDTTT